MKGNFYCRLVCQREKHIGIQPGFKLGLLNFRQMLLPCDPALELEQRIDGIYLQTQFNSQEDLGLNSGLTSLLFLMCGYDCLVS